MPSFKHNRHTVLVALEAIRLRKTDKVERPHVRKQPTADSNAVTVVCHRKEGDKVYLLALLYTIENGSGAPWTSWRFPTETAEPTDPNLEATVSACVRQEIADTEESRSTKIGEIKFVGVEQKDAEPL